MKKTVFYLKVNTNTDVAVACFHHWVDIVGACGADYYVVCDNLALQAKICNEENKDRFIPSSKTAKDMLTGVVSFYWLNTGAALLTPFLHAKANGYETFFNIDADDTVMCCNAGLAAKALEKVQEYADASDINCLSLDMHSTIHEHYYVHWSFGITYTKLDVDYIGAIQGYNALKPDLGQKDLLRGNNLDEVFTNLRHLGMIKTTVFNIENMCFVHVPSIIHISENGIYKILKRSFNFHKHIPVNIPNEIEIPSQFVRIDIPISKSESLHFLQENAIFEEAVGNPLSPNRQFNLRCELAKDFELFRKNMDTPIYLFSGYNRFPDFCDRYSHRTGYNLLADIEGFIDNNPTKWHTKKLNSEVFSPAGIKKDAFIIVPTDMPHVEKQIVTQLKGMGLIQYYHFCLDYELEYVIKRILFTYTRKFQGIHAGKRCFIVGNGPSLNLADIEKLKRKDEIVLVSNNFSEWFGKSDFRPDYYFLCDMAGVKKENELSALSEPDMVLFADLSYKSLFIRHPDNFYYFEQSPWVYYSEYPYHFHFSSDIALSFGAGSVTYIMLQMAVNMGFTEIYLLGMDNDFPTYINHRGELTIDDSVPHHFHSDSMRFSVYTKDMYELAFAFARDYCEKRGVGIYNATRGGKLDVFERIDFDSLF